MNHNYEEEDYFDDDEDYEDVIEEKNNEILHLKKQLRQKGREVFILRNYIDVLYYQLFQMQQYSFPRGGMRSPTTLGREIHYQNAPQQQQEIPKREKTRTYVRAIQQGILGIQKDLKQKHTLYRKKYPRLR